MPPIRLPLAASSLGAELGPVIREGRQLAGWTQRELAERGATSQATIWRLETNQAEVLDLAVVERVLKVLGIRSALELDGRHFMDRRRQLDAVHARMSGYVARRLRGCGWLTALEVQIGDPPRGWIDLMAFREDDKTLLVEETKSDMTDIGALQRSLRFYEREALRAAWSLGWRPRRVVVVCIVLDSAEVALRISGARDLLREAFPADVSAFGRWLSDPTAPMPDGWCLAAVDPASRSSTWLRHTHLARRRRPVAYEGYADAVRTLGLT